MRRFAIAPIVGILLAGLTSTVAATNAGTNACSSAAPCLSGLNSAPAGSSGAGVKGMAINSYGVRGISTTSVGLLGQSASGSLMEPGVEGESTYSGTSTVDDLGGAFGLTSLSGGHTPQTGALGIGLSSGISGENASSSSSMSAGVLGSDVTGNAAGVVGESEATSSSKGGVGVAGMFVPDGNNIIGIGVYGRAAGTARYGSNAVYGGYFVSDAPSKSPITYYYGLGVESSDHTADFNNISHNTELTIADSTTSTLLEGYNATASSDVFSVDENGNIFGAGTITGSNIKASGEAMYRQSGASGSTLTAYGTRAASPELEDVGDAELVNGRAIVHIDAKLADVIDRRSAYHVFVTPEGDCNGLYVTQKTPTSFIVAELRGGRSTMSFDYRIVATPYGHTRERLALAPPLERPVMPPAAMLERDDKAVHLPSFIAPPDRALLASIGSRRYARVITAKRGELARP